MAALAVLTAVEAGYQAAVMAPTEILAEQHFMTFRQLLEPLGLRVSLLTSSLKPRARSAERAALAAGETHCAVGTHALVQEDVGFRRLGLAVVDEQHRFGVEQRARLKAKGEHLDLLVMTATPIPRTLALTLYGDLDVSVIDALPPGRRPVTTAARTEAKRRAIYTFLGEQAAAGRQAYVVYPLVEESEALDLKAATDMARRSRRARSSSWCPPRSSRSGSTCPTPRSCSSSTPSASASPSSISSGDASGAGRGSPTVFC
ncbi:MAG: DEAD/DEAH box helicase [Candidatus Rokubacteria bacterium]|nr:DEAD/DEAH box helicase [Candidatus Rokubacteria bacterium]